MKRINNIKVPATKPYFFSNDKKFIIKKFKNILSGKSFLSMGQYGDLFEKKFSKFVGTKYAVACNSGTSALELICRGLSLENSEIIVPSNTFIASVNAILNSGAKPIFADCAEDMCLSFESIKKKITNKTSAIMIVHIGGIISSDIDKIYKFCKKKKIYLIEDAAQAHGSFLNNKKAGSFGEAAAFSFFSTKVMTTGEGGMVTTNNYKLVKKMKSLREFGKVKKGILTNYHTNIGYNWRLAEVCSLMGLTQLKKINELIKWREKISKYYYKHLNRIKQVDIITPIRKGHNYYKFIIYLKGIDRKIVHNNLKKKNVHLSGYVYELPLHKQPVFKKYNKLKLKNTEKYCKNHICLPLFYGMTIKQASFVATQLKKLLQ